MIDISGLEYYIFDNLEMTGLCESETISGSGQEHQGNDTYMRYGSMCNNGACSGSFPPVVAENLYIHGWSHSRFAGANGQSNCTTGVVCFNIFAFQGGIIQGGMLGETITHNVVDGVDSDPIGGGLCYGGFYNVSYNIFRYTSQCIPGGLHLFHDNLYEYFFENGHSNLLESLDTSGTNAIYNNVFRHIEQYLSSGGGVFLWFGPPSGTTDYVFNNLGYDVGSLEYFNLGGVGVTSNPGNYTLFNNVWQSNVSQAIFGCTGSSPIGIVKDTNNLYITDGGRYLNGPCSTVTSTSDLLMGNATATTDGYTASQTFGYSPAASNSPTVGKGTNENGTYCSALSSAGLSAAATACQSDITYACSYAGNGAAPVCPARTVNARPSSGTWDIGAYEFNTQDPPLNPPSGLTATVN